MPRPKSSATMLLALCLFLIPFNNMVVSTSDIVCPGLAGALFDFRPRLRSKAGEFGLLESGSLLGVGIVGEQCATQDKSC